MNYLTVKNPVKVVDKYQFNEGQITTYNEVQEVHAVHRETKEDVTLRSIQLQGKNQHIYDYMQQELTLLKWLNHESIIRCHRIFKTRNHLYFVYDYLPGYPLSELIQGGCNFQRVLEVVNGLLKALVYLDQRDIIHGQLDPQSIILYGGAKLVLKNFGYGIQIMRETMPLPSFHGTKKINKYTPPQSLQLNLTSKSDVYSLGCIILDLLEAVRGPSSRQTQYGHHIATFAVRMQEKKPEGRPDLQEVIDYFRSRPYEKKIVTFKIPSLKKRSTNTQQNAAKLKLKLYPNNQISPSILDCNREGRKILAKRNFQKFLFQIARLCGKLPLSTCQSLCFGVIMTKKAVRLACQLLKLIKTGSGDTLRIDERTMARIHNHTLFKELEAMITREKEELQELFDLLSNAIKQKLKKEDHPKLFKELTVEHIQPSFFKDSLQKWLSDAIEWLKSESVRPQKEDLILLCVLTFLLDYPSLDEGFNVLCGENGVDLWDEPLFQQLGALADCNLQKLIILEGESKSLGEEMMSSQGSSRLSRQKK